MLGTSFPSMQNSQVLSDLICLSEDYLKQVGVYTFESGIGRHLFGQHISAHYEEIKTLETQQTEATSGSLAYVIDKLFEDCSSLAFFLVNTALRR